MSAPRHSHGIGNGKDWKNCWLRLAHHDLLKDAANMVGQCCTMLHMVSQNLFPLKHGLVAGSNSSGLVWLWMNNYLKPWWRHECSSDFLSNLHAYTVSVSVSCSTSTFVFASLSISVSPPDLALHLLLFLILGATGNSSCCTGVALRFLAATWQHVALCLNDVLYCSSAFNHQTCLLEPAPFKFGAAAGSLQCDVFLCGWCYEILWCFACVNWYYDVLCTKLSYNYITYHSIQ